MTFRASLVFTAILVITALPFGCAHPAPHAISLPTTAAIRAPIVAAQASNAQALGFSRREQAIVAKATSKGMTAADVAALSPIIDAHATADAQTQDQLAAALYQAGELDRAMVAKQKQIDALAKHDALETTKNFSLARTVKHWRMTVFFLVIADYFIGAPIQRCLRAAVAFCWGFLVRGYRFVAMALKTAFPLYLFWLPA